MSSNEIVFTYQYGPGKINRGPRIRLMRVLLFSILISQVLADTSPDETAAANSPEEAPKIDENQRKNLRRVVDSVAVGIQALVGELSGNGTDEIDPSKLVQGMAGMVEKVLKRNQKEKEEDSSQQIEAKLSPASEPLPPTGGKDESAAIENAGQVSDAEMREFLVNVMKPDNLWDWIPLFFRPYVTVEWKGKLEGVLISDLSTLKPLLEKGPGGFQSFGEFLEAIEKDSPKIYGILRDIGNLFLNTWKTLETSVEGDKKTKEYIAGIKKEAVNFYEKTLVDGFHKLEPENKLVLVDRIGKAVPALKPILGKWKSVAIEKTMDDVMGNLLGDLKLDPEYQASIDELKKGFAELKEHFKNGGGLDSLKDLFAGMMGKEEDGTKDAENAPSEETPNDGNISLDNYEEDDEENPITPDQSDTKDEL